MIRTSRFALFCGLAAAALAAPLSAPQAGSYSVPIYVNAGNYSPNRYNIYAAVGNGAMVPYLFDTGAPYMLTVYGAAGTAPTDTLTFASGTTYGYWVNSSTMSLGDRNGATIATTATMNIGEVSQINGNNTTGGPLGDGTYGDFGASLYGTSTLATVLTQIPLDSGLIPGWNVNVAGLTSGQGTLTLGLSPAMIAAAKAAPGAIVMQMTPSGNFLPNANGGTVTGYDKAYVGGTTVTLVNGANTVSQTLGTVFDTGGGPNAVIYNPAFLPAAHGHLTISYNGMTFVDYTDTTPYGGHVVVDTDISGGLRVNPGGAAIYENYQVMFIPVSTQGGTGELILVPVPEPASLGVLAAGLLGLGALRRRR